MLASCLLFAAMGVCIKFSAHVGFSVAEIAFYRSGIALALMTALMLGRRVSPLTPHWRFQLSRSLTGFFSMTLNFWAITLLPLATAMTLNYTSPLFLALLLVGFAGLKLNTGMALSLTLGFFGVGLLLHPSLAAEQWFGALLGLSSGVLAACSYYNIRELGARGEPEVRTVFYFSLFATLLSLFWLAFTPLQTLRLDNILPLLGVGAFATLAQLCMTRAYSRGKALLNASLSYLTVIFASLFGVLLWHEHLGWSEMLGMIFITLAGIAAGHFSRARIGKAG
jgi:S-adenosylmethionine uptake transporter